MDAREMDNLVQRLVHDPHDEEVLAYAHQAGQVDPRSYAMLLEKVGQDVESPQLVVPEAELRRQHCAGRERDGGPVGRP